MSGLDRVAQSIQRKKLTLDDYKPEIQQEVLAAKQLEVLREKQNNVKVTIYLSEESSRKLNEICSENILKNGKMDKSVLIERAIELLYEERRK